LLKFQPSTAKIKSLPVVRLVQQENSLGLDGLNKARAALAFRKKPETKENMFNVKFFPHKRICLIVIL
jgi:hypothetical protein